MDLSITTAATVIAVSGMIIAALSKFVMVFKKEESWKKPIDEIKNQISVNNQETRDEIKELKHKIELLKLDSSKIEEMKKWLDQLEESIDHESDKLEKKLDDLMRLLLEFMKGGRK